MDLLLATRNVHKTREIAEMLGRDFRVHDLASVTGVPVAEETGRTFAENAVIKAVSVSKHVRALVLADDSGLEVDALNGAPGVFSARYAGANASDAENLAKLRNQLRGRTPARARFRCALALACDGALIHSVEGTVEGQLVDPPRGECGFGYDPMFVPDGFDKTFAELPLETKNRVSHRAQALAQLRKFLLTLR